MRQLVLLGALAVLSPVSVPVQEVVAQPVGGTLRVHFLNVGQADAIYIECPTNEHNLLIDTRDVTAMRYPGSPKLFQDQLQTLLGTKHHIDVLVSTHPHSDHAGSLRWVLEHFDVTTFLDDGMNYDSATYKKVREKAAELAATGKLRFLHAPAVGNLSKDIDFCPADNVDSILLNPNGFGHDENPNNNSVIVKMNFNNQTFLFTGDAEEAEEQLLLADPATKPLLAATVLKAAHHGSNTSSSLNFLSAVHPQIIVVSAGEKAVGTNNGYKHPRAETIQRFLTFTKSNGDTNLRTIDAFDTAKKRWVTVEINQGMYVTTVDGSIMVASDGQKTWQGEGASEPEEETPVRYVYSKNSSLYHFEGCADAKKIKPENRVTSKAPPNNKQLHSGCPR